MLLNHREILGVSCYVMFEVVPCPPWTWVGEVWVLIEHNFVVVWIKRMLAGTYVVGGKSWASGERHNCSLRGMKALRAGPT